MVQLNVLNGRSYTQRKSLNCGCGCNSCNQSQVVLNGLFENIGDSLSNAYHSVGDWINKAWNVSLNMDDLLSDSYNFHLEVFDGVQRQWTGVDLIKTNFTAPWIKDAADTLTLVSHIAGAVIITYFAGPAVMPILTGVGIMIGSAIRTQDTRYIEYIESMRNYSNKNLTPQQQVELIAIIAWALFNLKLKPVGGGELKKYFDRIKSGGSYGLKEFFREMKDWGYNNKRYMLDDALNNVSFADTVKQMDSLRWNLLCFEAPGAESTLFPKEEARRYAYSILVGDKTMTDAYNHVMGIRNKMKNKVNFYCNSKRPGYNPNTFTNPYIGYINTEGNTISTIIENDPNVTTLPTGTITTNTYTPVDVVDPIYYPGDPVHTGDPVNPIDPFDTGSIDETIITDTSLDYTPGIPPKQSSLGGVGMLLLLVGGGMVISGSKTSKRKIKKR